MKTPYISEDLFRQVYGATALRDHLPLVQCDTVMAIIESFTDYRFLLLELYGRPGEHAFVTGNCRGLFPEEAVMAEVRSETGYQNMISKKLGLLHEAAYHPARGQNQFSHHTVFFCRLTDNQPMPVSKGELELHRPIWVPPSKVLDKLTARSHRAAWIAWQSRFLREA